jgi:phage baseplate assembly protein W
VSTLEAIIDQSVETAAVTQFVGKIERGLNYWLPFVTNL